jgi:hypothetical protein
VFHHFVQFSEAGDEMTLLLGIVEQALTFSVESLL